MELCLKKIDRAISGYRLEAWIIKQRANCKDNRDWKRRKKLDSIGMIWTKRVAHQKTSSDVKTKEKNIVVSVQTGVELN